MVNSNTNHEVSIRTFTSNN